MTEEAEALPSSEEVMDAADERPSPIAFARLEGMIHEASHELRRLRDENAHLKEMLERRGREPERWSEEREELRLRVEQLTRDLEALLES